MYTWMHFQLFETSQHALYLLSHVLFWKQLLLLNMLDKSKPIFGFITNTYELQLFVFINQTEYSKIIFAVEP